MRTEQDLNADILKITMLIQEKFPELSKFITEMPVTVPNVEHPEVGIKALKDYYDSLKEMLRKYDSNHVHIPE